MSNSEDAVKSSATPTLPEDFAAIVREVLIQNSGGMKFISFMFELINKSPAFSGDKSGWLEYSPNDLLQMLEAVDNVKVIKYNDIIEPGLYREKYFICTVY